MLQFDNAPNFDLISAITGKAPAAHLVQRYGRLTDLAQASFDDLQQVPGVGKSKAAAIKSAFLLAQRLTSEAYPEPPLLDTPDRVANLLREQNRALYPCLSPKIREKGRQCAGNDWAKRQQRAPNLGWTRSRGPILERLDVEKRQSRHS